MATITGIRMNAYSVLARKEKSQIEVWGHSVLVKATLPQWTYLFNGTYLPFKYVSEVNWLNPLRS